MRVPRHDLIEEEERLLADIRRLLLERPRGVGASDDQLVAELRRIRSELGTAKAEDQPALLQQYEQLHALLQQLRRGRSAAEVDPDCPYFGHMRIREEGRSRDLFIGRATRLDHGLRIVDWRHAPISRIFYTCREGEEFDARYGGREREGRLEVRRTLGIEGGRLCRVDAPQGTWERRPDGTWAEVGTHPARLDRAGGAALVAHALGAGTGRRLGAAGDGRRVRVDKHLPDIVALIDPAQFEAICRPDSGPVILRGGAGSGKTTVALHRVAWLNYQDTERFHPRRMAVFVWGRALRDFISRVLPGLGVEGVPVATWGAWSARMVRQNFPFLPRQRSDTAPSEVVRLKLHPAIPRLLEAVVRDEPGPETPRRAFEDWCRLFTDADLLRRGLERHAPGAFGEEVVREVVERSRRQQARVLDWLEGQRDEEAELDVEDDALLLRLAQLRAGPLRSRRRPLRLAHLVVDEVQDFSLVELEVLLDLVGPRRCVTLAGDTRQHILQEHGFEDWAALLEVLGARAEVADLEVGYRSTAAISRFAQAILGPLGEGEPPLRPAREGAPVELFRFTDHGAAVAMLADALHDLARQEPLASVALVAPDPAVADLYHRGLARAEVPELRRVRDQAFAFAPGVDVVTIDDVKGLEFDYVVLLEATARHYPDQPHARRLLHVGATRAALQLWLTAVGAPSPILRDAGLLG